MMGISMELSVVGRDWSPVPSNKARGCCCRTSCRPSNPAVFAHTLHSASRLLEIRGRAGAQAAKKLYQLPIWLYAFGIGVWPFLFGAGAPLPPLTKPRMAFA